MAHEKQWSVEGVYGIWRLSATWEPNPNWPAHDIPDRRLWPEDRFSGVVEYFRDIINLHELELDQDYC